MRCLMFLPLFLFLDGCAGQSSVMSNYTYWVEDLSLQFSGDHESFLSEADVKERLFQGLVHQFASKGLQASSMEAADFIVRAHVVYERAIQDDAISSFALGGGYLANVLIGYKVDIKGRDGTILSSEMPAQRMYAKGMIHDMQTIMNVLGRSTNKHSEDVYVDKIPEMIVAKIMSMP